MMVFSEVVTIILDMSATIADNQYVAYPVFLVNVLNMLYFEAYFVRAYVMYLFAASVLKGAPNDRVLTRNLIALPLYFGLFMAFLSAVAGSQRFPYVIYYVDRSGYHEGLLYDLLYVIGFFYILVALVTLFLFRKSLRRKREKYGILLYNLLIAVALVVRLSWPQYLIMDTIVLMAILIVFLAFENPEFYLDSRGNVFNRMGLSQHLEENIDSLRHFAVGMVIRNYDDIRDIYGSAQMEEGLALISRYLKQLFPRELIFYCRNGRYVIMIHPELRPVLEDKRLQIEERFSRPWKSQNAELYLSVAFATFEELRDVHSPEIMMSTMMRTLEMVGKTDTSEPFVVDEKNLHQAEKEKAIRQCIEKAIEEDGFELYLQPIVEGKTEKMIGAEALSRIRDAEGKIIMPGDFIPVAENTGRINELGELVFERACRFIQEEGLEKLGLSWINVNLSPVQFLRTDLAERFSAIVQKYGVNPAQIHLEITEEVMIDERFLQRQITSLCEKGFQFVLDDYGTGYSNLARLKRCPFINIKLDMSIVRDYCKEPDDILPNMIQAFKHMGFSVTAEGVENAEMVEAMRKIECDFLQGYHYAKPVPARELAQRIVSWGRG
ncbi:MAG: EAL domain-containing protein [Lachnospiraceae bacterium]|nr:EAL domain-containing protein [Lachnospiraceae bacterium]